MANKKSSSNKTTIKKTAVKKGSIKESNNMKKTIFNVIILIIFLVAIILLLVNACKKQEEPKKEDEKPVADIVDNEDDNGLKNYDDTTNYEKVVYLANVYQEEVKKEEVKETSKVSEEPTSEITLDVTAPTVEGVEENAVSDSFTIYATDDITYSDRLLVKIDGEDYVLGEPYTKNGDHTLVVTDEAGNETIIHFTVAIIVVNSADEIADLNGIIANAEDGDIIYLSSDVYEDINIDKSIIIRGCDYSSINGYVNITNGDVTLDGVTINNTTGGIAYSGTNVTLIKVDTTGSFTLKDSVIEGNNFTARNAITINNASNVEITGNTFGDGLVYNYIEFGGNTIVKHGTNISNNKFTSSSCTHNQINMYNFEENAIVNINNNYFEKSANALRIANRNNARATINMIGNRYDATDSDLSWAWAGLFLAQPWNPSVEDFSTITVNVENLIGPGGNLMISNVPGTINQIYYTWNTTTEPIVNIR